MRKLSAKQTMLCLAIAGLPALSVAATLTIDASKQYQTIEGFGSYGCLNPLWGSPTWNSQFADRMVDDLGATVIRTGWGDDGWLDFVKYMNGKGVKVIASVWDPMQPKVEGHMSPSAYPAFADACVAYANRILGMGINLYAFSPQNEPFFEPAYGGCIYTPQEMHAMMKILGAKWEAAGLLGKVKIFWAENMLEDVMANRGYLGLVCSDAVTRKYVYAFATHGYQADGITATSMNTLKGLWSSLYESKSSPHYTKKYGVPNWMTETSGYADAWLGGACAETKPCPGAFGLGYSIYAALRYGKLSLWCYWQTSQKGGDSYVMIDGNSQTQSKRWNAAKQFYKFIRPGAVMMESSCSDSTVGVVTFKHVANKTITMVLLNTSSGDKAVSIAGGGTLPAQLQGYRTSASDDFRSLGAIASTSEITLPGTSITTLLGENYTPPPVGVRQQSATFRSALVSRSVDNTAGTFRPDGRRMSGNAASAPAGAYYRVMRDAAGGRMFVRCAR